MAAKKSSVGRPDKGILKTRSVIPITSTEHFKDFLAELAATMAEFERGLPQKRGPLNSLSLMLRSFAIHGMQQFAEQNPKSELTTIMQELNAELTEAAKDPGPEGQDARDKLLCLSVAEEETQAYLERWG